MPNTTVDRWPTKAMRGALRRRFKAALALAGRSRHVWCAEHDVSTEHLRQCFAGERNPGEELASAVETFIAKHL